MTKKSIKDGILTILKKEKRLTVAELSTYFEITDIALRRHIHTMEREGLLKATIEKQTLGRPSYKYHLTEKGEGYFPSEYQQFSVDILEQLEMLKGREFVYHLLVERLNKQRSHYNLDIPEQVFTNKVKHLKTIQDEKGYMTDLVSNEDGTYTLKQYNCPILSVANQYQKVCDQEAKFFEDVLNFNVSLTTCIANGSTCCSFLIKE